MTFAVAGAALVLLDCEEGVAARAFPDPEGRREFVAGVRASIDAAQRRGMPCVRVEVEFRAGHLDVAATNSYFAGAKAAGRLLAGSDQSAPMAELASLLEPLPRVVKRRIGALAHTDLAPLLGGLGCDGIVLAGLITRGAVLSTAAHAADLDYRVAVLADACHDPDPAVHDLLVREVLPMRAAVLTSAELEALAGD